MTIYISTLTSLIDYYILPPALKSRAQRRTNTVEFRVYYYIQEKKNIISVNNIDHLNPSEYLALVSALNKTNNVRIR
jgi:hypothetical protein